ncbi:MAG: hypothetical protein M3297_15210 [Thermoproteota archaeon]|nr:hypothetical protein [Thermoproteota archaeon]
MEYEQRGFYDKLSQKLYHEFDLKIKDYSQSQVAKAMFELGRFNIAQSYVTSKTENRNGDIVKINIEGGRCGIELQETLFDLNGKKLSHAYLITEVKQELSSSGNDDVSNSRTGRGGGGGSSTAWRQQHNTIPKILVRRLPIIGIKDWLLIYEDTLFLLAVKDAYDEMEIIALPDD